MNGQTKPYKRGNQGINDAAADITIMLSSKPGRKKKKIKKKK